MGYSRPRPARRALREASRQCVILSAFTRSEWRLRARSSAALNEPRPGPQPRLRDRQRRTPEPARPRLGPLVSATLAPKKRGGVAINSTHSITFSMGTAMDDSRLSVENGRCPRLAAPWGTAPRRSQTWRPLRPAAVRCTLACGRSQLARSKATRLFR